MTSSLCYSCSHDFIYNVLTQIPKLDLATKEVILSAGALNDPKILMHSGIGPKSQLEKFGIPVVSDVPAIGQGLKDHAFVPLAYSRASGDANRAAFYSDKAAMASALEQWTSSGGAGPWARYGCEMPIGWFKLPSLAASPEFQALPDSEKDFLSDPTVPHYELLSHFPLHWFVPFADSTLNYNCLLVFLYNAQAHGEVTLQSADPAAPLRFDPKFLSTAFDRRAAIESLRDAYRIVRHEAYVKDNVATIAGPKGESDEELLEYWRQSIGSSWHMTGTVKMGRKGGAGEDVAVDSDFRLIGFEGLRVADMSVVPIIMSCHVQAVAYLTGLTCAEKLIAEYQLA